MGAVSNEKEYSVTVIDDIVELEINGFVICKSIQLWHNLALREQAEQRAVESKDTETVITEDKFEQLAKEASFNIYKSDLWRGTGQRFAESIVKECIRLCDQVDLAGADDCIDKIRDHFGIE